MIASDRHAGVTAEIMRLHAFLECWFQGTLPVSALDDDLAAALHPEFENIQPAGTVLSRDVLLEGIAKAHGTNPDFRIEIREPRVLCHWPGSGLTLAGYVEAQFGARNTTPSDNLRRSTVLFERAGRRLVWRYLHETALIG